MERPGGHQTFQRVRTSMIRRCDMLKVVVLAGGLLLAAVIFLHI